MCTVYGLKNKTPRISYTVHGPGLGQHMTTLKKETWIGEQRVKGENSLCRDLSQKTVAIFREHLYNMGHRWKRKQCCSVWLPAPPWMTLNSKTAFQWGNPAKISKALSKQSRNIIKYRYACPHWGNEYLDVWPVSPDRTLLTWKLGLRTVHGNWGAETQETDHVKDFYITGVFPGLKGEQQLSFPLSLSTSHT